MPHPKHTCSTSSRLPGVVSSSTRCMSYWRTSCCCCSSSRNVSIASFRCRKRQSNLEVSTAKKCHQRLEEEKSVRVNTRASVGVSVCARVCVVGRWVGEHMGVYMHMCA